jgi:hypothetical protein
MVRTLLTLIALHFSLSGNSQTTSSLSDVMDEISVQWKVDSVSCKGFRKLLVKKLLTSQIDASTKNLIFNKLGKPNRIQRFYNGVTNQNCIAFIYDVYKDACPKTEFEGFSIQFVFDEKETNLIEITGIDYCG